MKKNILFQDNKSTILLEKKGHAAAGKRSGAIDIQYFTIKDHVEKGDLEIECCPTNSMIGHFFYLSPGRAKNFKNLGNCY